MCTQECGRLDPPAESELLDAFQIVARDAFAFLGPEHGLRPSPMVTFGVAGSGRVAVDSADAAYPFLAILEFTGSNRPVRLSYGGRAYHLDLDIAANGTGFHSLGSWLDALDIEHDQQEDSGVATPTALAHHARRLAGGLRDHFAAIGAAGHDAIGRLPALAARSALRLNRVRDQAHAAFAGGDYAAYVELLAPFENALTLTERRKLDFARGKQKSA